MVSASRVLRKLTDRPLSSERCNNAALILKYAHDSTAALLKAFELTRKTRGRPRGMTTDEEQDLLRAMLAMAAAGMDAVTKQLIADALPELIGKDAEVRGGLETFVSRQIRGEGEIAEVAGGRKFLARVLAASSQQAQVIEDYVLELVRGSLQSAGELTRVARALGVEQRSLGVDMRTLDAIFEIRNKIVHELDINLDADRRKRNIRGVTDMISYSEALIRVSENIIAAVDAKLAR